MNISQELIQIQHQMNRTDRRIDLAMMSNNPGKADQWKLLAVQIKHRYDRLSLDRMIPIVDELESL